MDGDRHCGRPVVGEPGGFVIERVSGVAGPEFGGLVEPGIVGFTLGDVPGDVLVPVPVPDVPGLRPRVPVLLSVPVPVPMPMPVPVPVPLPVPDMLLLVPDPLVPLVPLLLPLPDPEPDPDPCAIATVAPATSNAANETLVINLCMLTSLLSCETPESA
jgi:hypothetical protein